MAKRTSAGKGCGAQLATWALAAAGLGAALALLAVLLIGDSKQQMERRWEEAFGSFEERQLRWPDRDSNAAALDIERLVEPLGFAIRTASQPGRFETVTSDEYFAAQKEIERFLRSELLREEGTIQRPGALLRDYLDTHSESIEAIRKQLLGGDQPL